MTTAITKHKDETTWSEDQVALVKRTVAKDATTDELGMFMHLANKYNLDPFAKEIWFLKMGSTPTIMTSRDGYLKIANENTQFDGLCSDVVYEKDTFEKTPDGVKHVYGVGNRGTILGAYTLIYRKDRQYPIYVFAPFKDYNKGNGTWKTYPHAMILKVAESMALKRAFSLSGLVSTEEIGTPDAKEEPADTITVEVVETQPAKSLREEPAFNVEEAGQTVKEHKANLQKRKWEKVTELRDNLGWTKEELANLVEEKFHKKSADCDSMDILAIEHFLQAKLDARAEQEVA